MFNSYQKQEVEVMLQPGWAPKKAWPRCLIANFRIKETPK